MDAARGARTEPGCRGLQDTSDSAYGIIQRCAAVCGRYMYLLDRNHLSFKFEGWLEPTAKLGSRITAFVFAKPQVAPCRAPCAYLALYFAFSLVC